MIAQTERLASDTLGLLNRREIGSRRRIVRLLSRMIVERVPIRFVDSSQRLWAHGVIKTLESASLVICLAKDGTSTYSRSLFGTFQIDGSSFYFPVKLGESGASDQSIVLPRVIYSIEKRAQQRRLGCDAVEVDPEELAIQMRVLDRSEVGMCIRGHADDVSRLGRRFIVRDRSETRFATVRHVHREQGNEGWRRLGLSTSGIPEDTAAEEQVIENLSDHVEEAVSTRGIVGPCASRNVEFTNDRDRAIVGCIDALGPIVGALFIVIPPAWGHTKESYSALMLSIVETFQTAGRAVAILRYDGTNRRGESHVDVEHSQRGYEHLGFTFGEAAIDLRAAIRFARELKAARVYVVSPSLSSIEARKVISEGRAGVVDAWIPVMGVADLQATLRAVSGGVDYANGLMKGRRFGRREIMGVMADVDRTGMDAIKSSMATLEDARKQMSAIEIPISWFHGERDSWIDFSTVAGLMRCGEANNRRLIRVPAAHRVFDGRTAQKVFSLVGSECLRLYQGSVSKAVVPLQSTVRFVRNRENRNAGRRDINKRRFWRRYLLGQGRGLGMGLLCNTRAYREFAEMEFHAIGCLTDKTVADLGSGLGEFGRRAQEKHCPRQVVEIDLVREALIRTSSNRLAGNLSQVVANLDLKGYRLPFASLSLEAAMLSLVLSYVRAPLVLLQDVHRVMKPGARLVASSIRRDADFASIYSSGVREFLSGDARRSVGATSDIDFVDSVRDSMSSAAQLFVQVEQGVFSFFDGEELAALLRRAGFQIAGIEVGLDDPPQASIVTAIRP